MSDDSADPEPPAPVPLLTSPADGVPDVVDTPDGLASAIAAVSAGSGPIAIDTERAQSYRYSARAYLIQLRRRGVGTLLIDPIAAQHGAEVADLSALGAAIAGAEWVVHAASQDLPSLVEVGMVPTTLFDTELAARLLGYPRVALGTLVEQHFGVRLLKEHSAADWSTRPLPHDWLVYAALDVELLIELRDALLAELVAAGRDGWARQEFAHLVAHAGEVTVRVDPWRRTSGLAAVRNPTGLALVRELWKARDELARRLDKAPTRIVGDAGISELATFVNPATRRFPGRKELRAVPLFRRKNAQRFEEVWLAAIERVVALPRSALPPMRPPSADPPPPRAWQTRFPDAFARWHRLRPAVNELAEQHGIAPEILLSPDHLRRLTWQPPDDRSPVSVDARLAELGARPWQRELVVPVVSGLLADMP